MIFLNWHVRWGHNSKTMIHRKKIKLTSEREFKTVVLKKTQSGCFQLIHRYCVFCGYCPPCLGSSALELCMQCLQRFSLAHQWSPAFIGAHEVGVVTEEIIKGIEVGAVWGPLDLGFAADDAAPKLCVEVPPDFCHCLACRTIPLFPLFPLFQPLIHMWKTMFGWKYAELLVRTATEKCRMAWRATQQHSLMQSFRATSSAAKPRSSGPHTAPTSILEIIYSGSMPWFECADKSRRPLMRCRKPSKSSRAQFQSRWSTMHWTFSTKGARLANKLMAIT